MVDEVRSHLMRAPRRARWTAPPAFAGERHKKVIAAAVAEKPRKSLT
jgi:hypothetical protein